MRRLPAMLVGLLMVLPASSAARADDATCPEAWHQVGEDDFRLPGGLLRSQGVATDGAGWVFSWLGGLERTDDAYTTRAVAGWPADIVVNEPSINPDGTNHLMNNHIGDIDYYNGKIYAPYEDGNQEFVNDPEYQHPYVAVYDAKTLLYTGEHYALPAELHDAGVPWVAIDARKELAYTAEWEMPHDRINVFSLDFRFKRFIDLNYEAVPGLGHLDRIQGAKVWRGDMYVTRDDAEKSVFRIDLDSGVVTKLFSLNPHDRHDELEGLAIRQTSDGAFLHLILIRDFSSRINELPTTVTDTRVSFIHIGKGDCD